VTNFVYSDFTIPFHVKTNYLITGRVIGKFAGDKSMTLMWSGKGYGRIDS